MFLAVVVTSVVAPACAISGVSFRHDDRLAMLAPERNARESLPVTVAWRADDLDDDEGRPPTFVVFVDRAPLKPGETIRDYARRDDTCERIPTCPDDRWLSANGISVTTATSVTLERVLPLASGPRSRRDLHEVTVVVLDADGRRRGEMSVSSEFRIDRDQE